MSSRMMAKAAAVAAVLALHGPAIAASPVEAVEAATEQADGAGQAHMHGAGDAPGFWSHWSRVVVAAAVGTLIYHFVTFVIQLVRRRGRPNPISIDARSGLPPGSHWISMDGRTSLIVDSPNEASGVFAHSWSSRGTVRTEAWRVSALQPFDDAPDDLIGVLVCPAHGGRTGRVLVHRGGHNDLALEARFSDARLKPIVVVLRRILEGTMR